MNENDRCPHPRPFAADFQGCVAYQPIAFLPGDAGGRPMSSSWTCRNLEAAPMVEGRSYPRCRLGDAAARAAWAGSIGERRNLVRQLRLELVAGSRHELEAFLAEQRAAARLPLEERRPLLAPLAEALIRRLAAIVDGNLPVLRAADFDPDTAKAVLADMVWDWVSASKPVTTLAAPPALIARHPAVKELLAPER